MDDPKKEEGQLIMIDGIKLMLRVPAQNGHEEVFGVRQGVVLSGLMRERIILGMKTNDGAEMGVILTKNNALEIASILTKAACQGETKQ